jgi:hypothetical protein
LFSSAALPKTSTGDGTGVIPVTFIKHVQLRIQHPVNKWMAATLDGLIEPSGAVFEAKFMLP